MVIIFHGYIGPMEIPGEKITSAFSQNRQFRARLMIILLNHWTSRKSANRDNIELTRIDAELNTRTDFGSTTRRW